MADLIIFAAVFTFSMGVAVLWANPERFTNQIVGVMAAIVALHLIFIYYAANANIALGHSLLTNPIGKLRAGSSISETMDPTKDSPARARSGDRFRRYSAPGD